MKKTLILTFFLACGLCSFGQKYMTQNGSISFFSEAPLENIESTNNQVSSVINLDDGQMVFSLLMKAFVFEKALMQTHFNEKYVESETYPKSIFKGQIKDFENVNIGSEPVLVTVTGALTLHGVTKEITTTGHLHFGDQNQLVVNANMELALDDYNISIPSAVNENISNTIAVTIQLRYEKLD